MKSHNRRVFMVAITGPYRPQSLFRRQANEEETAGSETAAFDRGAVGNSGAAGPGDCPGGARPRTPLAGFTGAKRRSELVNLDVEDVWWKREGMIPTIRSSKMDQEGKGTELGVPFGRKADLPGRIAEGVAQICGHQEQSHFPARSRRVAKSFRGASGDRAVALIVKHNVGHAGFSPGDFSGHSLRVGLATSAAERGQHERDIMQQTSHKSVKMLRRYIRKGSFFREMSLMPWGSEILDASASSANRDLLQK